MIWHLMKGSPVYLSGQLHMGLWLTTWQRALMPQVPGQGSIHFWLTQAWFWAQSELVTHSGRQLGGLPKYPGTQEQTAWPLTTRHALLGPQGLGLQGLVGFGTKEKCTYMYSVGGVVKNSLLSIFRHSTKGSPMYPSIQVHAGM